jgi:chromosome segregation ATPase
LILRVANLDGLIKDLAGERKFLVERSNDLQINVDELEEKLRVGDADYYESVVKIKKLQDLLRERDVDLENRPNITKEEFKVMEQRLAKFKEKAHNRKLTITGLKAEKAELERQNKIEKELIVNLQGQLNQLEQDKKNANERLDALGKIETTSQETIKNQQKKIAEIEGQLKLVNEKLTNAQKKKSDLEKQLNEKDKELNKVNAELKIKKDELNNLRMKEIAELEGKVKYLETQKLSDTEKKVIKNIRDVIYSSYVFNDVLNFNLDTEGEFQNGLETYTSNVNLLLNE